MPLYEYRCHDGHTTTELRKMGDRTAPLDCVCGAPALPMVSLTATGLVSGGTNGGKGYAQTPRPGYVEQSPGVWVKGSSIDADKVVDWRCTACAEKGVCVDEPLPEACACGAAVEVYVNENARPADWFPKGGYYDRALGVQVESREHRARLLAERGLRESDDAEKDDHFRHASATRSQQDRDINEMLDEWDDDKERARMIDDGTTPDHAFAREVMGR